MYLANKTRPYETIKGAVDELAGKWLNRLETAFMEGKAQATGTMKQLSRALAEDFAALPQKAEHKIKVGIVGEIYIKYAGLGNNNLAELRIYAAGAAELYYVLCRHLPNGLQTVRRQIF